VRNALLLVLAVSLLVGIVGAAPCAAGEAAYSIRGSVVTPSGQPAGSVWVVVERDGNAYGRALTADDGRYYIPRLEAGPYLLLVRRGQSTVYRAQVSLPADTVHEIVLR